MDNIKVTTKTLGLSSIDELDAVKDLVANGSFLLLIKIVEKLCADMNKDVVSYNLVNLDDGSLSYLAYKKMKSQGGEKLLIELKAIQEAIKNKQ
jgi:hypothetical protein